MNEVFLLSTYHIFLFKDLTFLLMINANEMLKFFNEYEVLFMWKKVYDYIYIGYIRGLCMFVEIVTILSVIIFLFIINIFHAIQLFLKTFNRDLIFKIFVACICYRNV